MRRLELPRFLVPVVALMVLVANARAQNVLEDAFTAVSVVGTVPYLVTSPTSLDRTTAAEQNIGTQTAFTFTADSPDNWTPGEVEGTGWADSSWLGTKVELRGAAARKGDVSALTHDVVTVTAVSVAAGTPGLMTYYYRLGGDVTVKQFEGPTPSRDFAVASVSFALRKYTPDGAGGVAAETLGGQVIPLLGSDQLGTPTGGGLFQPVLQPDVPPTLHSIDVPFVFGEPFGLSATLKVSGETDHTFGRSGVDDEGYFELWGGGVVDELSVDFGSTFELLGIVSTEHPDIQVTGVGVDYSGFVTDTVPELVPSPSSELLLGGPLLALLIGNQRKKLLPSPCTSRL